MDLERRDAEVVRASLVQPAVFAEIFERHHARIWGYLARRGGRDWADEQAGEVFVIAFAKREQYDPGQGPVVGWLYGIALNQARDWFRRSARSERLLARVPAEIDTADSPHDRVADDLVIRQRLEQARRALEKLPERDREVIVLYAWERLTYEAIATALGISPGTVRSRLSRARSRLQTQVEADEARPLAVPHPERNR